MTGFVEFPKIPRLRRDCVITEKIDGTNAAVAIGETPLLPDYWEPGTRLGDGTVVTVEGQSHVLYAQSRKRVITPEDDNFGFAAWVHAHAEELSALGVGHHFGEWWGSGIQRGYGLPKGEKRFSLFNVARWADNPDRPSCVGTVPVIYDGEFSDSAVRDALEGLSAGGSVAVPGFDRPEGVVVFHKASGHLYKVLLEGDELPKGLAA